MNDNHAWAEVWLEGAWRPVDPGKHGLSHTGNAGRAPFVLALAYGNATGGGETVYRRLPGATLLNVTPDYAQTFEAEVAVKDEQKRPAANATVFAAVYNYGALRPVARIQTDEAGRGSIELGAGTYLLSSRRGNPTAFSSLSWLPELGEPEVAATRWLRDDAVLSGEFLFGIPGGEYAAAPEALGRNETMREKESRRSAERERRFAGFETLVRTFAREHGFNASLADELATARGNAPELMRALRRADESRIGPYVRNMAEKDRPVASAAEVLGSLELSAEARGRAVEMGVEYDEETFWSHVARDRLLYEPFSLWRADLQKQAAGLFDGGFGPGVRGVAESVASLVGAPSYVFGPNLRPQDVLALDAAPRSVDRCVLGAALLRSAGIPAECLDQWGFINYFDGSSWSPLFCDAPEKLGKANATAESRAFYGEPASVVVRFHRDGKNVSESVRYFRDFGLSRFNETGYFSLMEKTVGTQYLAEEDAVLLRLPEGRVYLMAGARGQDAVLVRVIAIEAGPGEVVGPVDVALDNAPASD